MKQFEQRDAINVEHSDDAALPGPDPDGSWGWLVAMGRSLGFVAQLLDARDVPSLPEGSGPVAVALKQALNNANSAVRMAAAAARVSPKGIAESGDPFRTVCYRLLSRGRVSGVLVLAHDSSKSSHEDVRRAGAAFEIIRAWLAKEDGEDDVNQIDALESLLQEGIDRGSEIDVVTAFGEALFAWEGIELHGYVEDSQGRLTKVFTAPGTSRGSASVHLDLGVAPRTTVLTRLSTEILEAVGLPQSRPTFGIQLETQLLEPWVFLGAGTFRRLDEERLAAAFGLLRDGLERAAVIAETRLTWSLLQPLLGDSRSAEQALDPVVRVLTTRLSASSALLTVVAPNGSTLLNIGEPEPSSSVRPFGRPQTLVATTSVRDRWTLTLTLRRPGGEVFSRREQHLVDRAAAVLAAWIPPTLGVSTRLRERRAETREFEQVLERTAARILRDGLSVSVLVVALPEAPPRADVLQGWVADIRARLRGSDLAGMLSDREIGVLLSGTPSREVPVVRARLEGCLAKRGPIRLAIGAASRDAGQLQEEPMVRAARFSAAPWTSH